MICPKCGFKNPDIRLFCSRCGEILPEAGSEPPEAGFDVFEPIGADRIKDEEAPDAEEAAPVVSAADDGPSEGEDDAPFEVADMFLDESAEKLKRRAARERTQSPAPNRLNEAASRSRRETMIPERDAITPDKFFTVRGQLDDRYKAIAPDDDDEYTYEEEDSFLVKHTRGIVFLLLFVLTLAVIGAWSLSDGGRRVLASRGFAWSKDTFAELGYEAYNAGDYEKAVYYLSRADRNENNIVALANSYIELKQTLYAVREVRELIRLRPDKADYYVVFAQLLGGYENMSKEDKQLYEDGYLLTGDERLKVN